MFPLQRDGVEMYRVRWKGCPREDDTWEPESHLLTCHALLKTFKEEREVRRKKRKLKRLEKVCEGQTRIK